jgi:hypothetical protein
MSARTYRTACAALLTSLAALTLAAPASAKDPRVFLGTPDPVLLPALNPSTGTGYCEGFDALITFTDVNQYIIHQTTDPATGDLTLKITGRARATVTNQTTGESVTFNISGPGTVVLDSNFNILSADAHGPNLFWTDQSLSFPGVPTISYTTGHVTFDVDASGQTTSYTLAGGARQTDVCAVLAS